MKKLLFVSCLFFTLLGGYAQSEPSGESFPVSKIKVFPNPATNVVNILGLENSDQASIFISDVYGNLVQQHQWSIKRNALNIPVTNLETGVYVLRIRSTSQEVTRKFYKR